MKTPATTWHSLPPTCRQEDYLNNRKARLAMAALTTEEQSNWDKLKKAVLSSEGDLYLQANQHFFDLAKRQMRLLFSMEHSGERERKICFRKAYSHNAL